MCSYISGAIQKYIVSKFFFLILNIFFASKNQVTIEKCGFIIHPRHGWLGASPDGYVVDKLCNDSEAEGILQAGCYTIRGLPRYQLLL